MPHDTRCNGCSSDKNDNVDDDNTCAPQDEPVRFVAPRVRAAVLVVAYKAFALGVAAAVGVALVAHPLVRPLHVPTLAAGVYVLVGYVAFHACEFVTAMHARPHDAHAGAFMLYHSSAYAAAQALVWVEYVVELALVPEAAKLSPQRHPWLARLLRLNVTGVLLFGALTLLCYAVRVVAMVQCGRNFALHVRARRPATQKLVCDGVYAYVRHPAYFGWFWRTVAAQLLLANPLSLCVHTAVTWLFFRRVIAHEEACMLRDDYFGAAYAAYRARTRIGIPFLGV